MNRRTQQRHSISGIFVFLILGIFAISSTVMVLIGAQAYKGSADRYESHNAERIASSYIRSKLREADAQGMLRIEAGGMTVAADAETGDGQASGSPVLQIVNEEEGTVTLLYVYEGMLYEWYTLRELAQDAASLNGRNGESVCPLDEMQVQTGENGLLTVRLREGDTWTEVVYTLRSDAL